MARPPVEQSTKSQTKRPPHRNTRRPEHSGKSRGGYTWKLTPGILKRVEAAVKGGRVSVVEAMKAEGFHARGITDMMKRGEVKAEARMTRIMEGGTRPKLSMDERLVVLASKHDIELKGRLRDILFRSAESGADKGGGVQAVEALWRSFGFDGMKGNQVQVNQSVTAQEGKLVIVSEASELNAIEVEDPEGRDAE